MCQIADKALVVSQQAQRLVSSRTYTAVAESGRMSEYQVVTITGSPGMARADQTEWPRPRPKKTCIVLVPSPLDDALPCLERIRGCHRKAQV
jgi:hypothetical protein